MTSRRIAAESRNLQRDSAETGLVCLVDDVDRLHWAAQVRGPQESPYSHRILDISITFKEDYPRSPPHITFSTPLFHPNVSPRGEIRLAEFEQSQWSPAITIRTILISLQAMLSDPNSLESCILNEEAAALYLRDAEEFKKRAGQ